MTDDRRRMLIGYAVGKRRAEMKAQAAMSSIADRFEAVNEATLEEIRSLRNDLTTAHMVRDAMTQRTETRLH
jgi:succinate dehydrogenase/fumarate reductase flavoprotein subunit